MGGWEKRLEELSHLKDGWYVTVKGTASQRML